MTELRGTRLTYCRYQDLELGAGARRLPTCLFLGESEPHAGHSTTSTGRQHPSLRGSEGIINLGLELPSADSSTLLGLCQLLADLPHRVVDESTGQPDSVPTGSPRTSTAERDVVTEGPVPESYSRVDELAEEASHPVHTPRPQRQRRPPVGYPDAEVNVTWL